MNNTTSISEIARDPSVDELDVSALSTHSLLASLPVANIGHEMRTPLSVIIAMAELMQSMDLDTELESIVGHIAEASDELLRRLDALLGFISPAEIRRDVVGASFSPQELVEEALRSVANARHAAELQFGVLETASIPPILLGDKHSLERVLAIVLDNALKFSERGEIRVDIRIVEEETSFLELRVSDPGVGIPDSDKERIFLPFVQLDRSDAKYYDGLGLGLAIARQLMRHNEGRIKLESSGDAGSTFLIQMPVIIHAGEPARALPVGETSNGRKAGR